VIIAIVRGSAASFSWVLILVGVAHRLPWLIGWPAPVSARAHLVSYQHAPILTLSARAHPHLISTRPSSSYQHAPILTLSPRAHPHLISTRPSSSYHHAPILILSPRAHPHLISTRPSTLSMTVCNLRSPILSSRASSHVRDASARPYLDSTYACLCSWPCRTVLAAGNRSPASPQIRATPAMISFVVAVTANMSGARESGSASGA
jgi:hypothetical protein